MASMYSVRGSDTVLAKAAFTVALTCSMSLGSKLRCRVASASP